MGQAGSTALPLHITTVSSPSLINPGLHLDPAIDRKLVELTIGEAVPNQFLLAFNLLAAFLADIFGEF